MNYAKYIREHVVASCPTDAVDVSYELRVRSSHQCFGNHDDTKFQVDDLEQTWRLWLFQGTRMTVDGVDHSLHPVGLLHAGAEGGSVHPFQACHA